MTGTTQRAGSTEALASDDMTLRELVLLAAVLTAGIAARLVVLSHSAVEHFDEGVYASNIYFGQPDFAYPQQRFYAPSLLPALIELGMIAGLPPNLAALLPSFLAGCATIVALWWFGRSWFGTEVGLAGAALVALSDFHITFSATALTDVLLGLWMLLAVDAVARSLLRGDYRWAIGAGIYTGLAWWTKYNGWLPLAIEAATLPVLWLLLRPPRRELLTWIGCFAVTSIIAAAVWSPFFLSLQSSGGYAPIAANHTRYVVGFSGWLDSAHRQMASQFVLGGAWSVLGLGLAFLMPQLLEPRRAIEIPWLIVQSFVNAVGVLFVTGSFVVGFGAALGIGRMVVAFYRAPRWDASWKRRAIGLFLILTWWGAMLVATPLYTPYPRLALPFLIAAWLATALNWADVLAPDDQQPIEQQWSNAWGRLVFAAWLVICVCLLSLVPHEDHWDRPADRRGLTRIAEQVRATDIRRQPRVIYVYGEPALFFQLRAVGEPNVSAIQTVPSEPATGDGQAVPTFLLAGPHAQRYPQFQQQLSAAKDRWELLHEYDYLPSPVVWLDLADPRQSPQKTADLDRVRLYRLRAAD